MSSQYIFFVQYADPALYPPVERAATILSQRGWVVKFLGVSARGQSAGVGESSTRGFDTELLTHDSGRLAALASYLRFWIRAWKRVGREKPDVVYCSDILSYPIGALVALFTNRTCVLHEHDTPPDKIGGPLSIILHWCRGRFARSASLCVLPQDERASAFQEKTGATRVQIAYNCPLKSELADRPKSKCEAQDFVIWHHGSLNSRRLHPCTLDALCKLPGNVRIEIAGYETESSEGFISELRSKAVKLGIEHRFIFHGPLSRNEIFEKAKNADLGLVALARDFSVPMVGASVKPFDYLACGLPLLVNDTEEWVSFFVSKGIARSTDPESAEQIANEVFWHMKNPKRHQDMAQKAQELIVDQWNYECQFQPVVSVIEKNLRRSK